MTKITIQGEAYVKDGKLELYRDKGGTGGAPLREQVAIGPRVIPLVPELPEGAQWTDGLRVGPVRITVEKLPE